MLWRKLEHPIDQAPGEAICERPKERIENKRTMHRGGLESHFDLERVQTLRLRDSLDGTKPIVDNPKSLLDKVLMGHMIDESVIGPQRQEFVGRVTTNGHPVIYSSHDQERSEPVAFHSTYVKPLRTETTECVFGAPSMLNGQTCALQRVAVGGTTEPQYFRQVQRPNFKFVESAICIIAGAPSKFREGIFRIGAEVQATIGHVFERRFYDKAQNRSSRFSKNGPDFFGIRQMAGKGWLSQQ